MEHITEMFIKAFITKDRWKLYISGLGITLEIALYAAVIGLIIGTAVALMKLSVTRHGKPSVLSYTASVYVDIIRGTPSDLQLLNMWFIVMVNSNNGVIVESISFGINS